MVGNFWLPEKVSGLWADAKQFKTLSIEEQRAYKWVLSFLIFLDSLQTVNVPNLADYITAPEVKLLLAIHAYQEAIHSQSYATILESVVDSKEREEIYYFWRDDKILLERNKYIWGIYQSFIDKPTDESFFKALVANFLLEGIYFYNGFAFFDTLADSMRMPATGRMIAYIRRDELTHLALFANILKEIKKEFPDIYSEQVVQEMAKVACEQEISWSEHILGKKIIGMWGSSSKTYTEWLTNQRLQMIWVPTVYSTGTTNPYKHLDRMQDVNADKGNFFETTVINYTQSSSLKGSWDF